MKSILDGIGAVYWPDVTADRVQAYLARRRTNGLSVESSNHYVRWVKQFARWMVRNGRADSSPLDSLRTMNANSDRRHDRRALEPQELKELLKTTCESKRYCNLSGPERAMLYRLVAETGLRVRELRSLTSRSFDLDGTPPTVTINAAYSKRRRTDTLPLRPELAANLCEFLGGRDPDVPVFATLPRMTARMLRTDLMETCIPYRDAEGRVADFHALRHTFITMLARSGVHPKTAQSLARHSTITLTMDRYTHTVIGALADALRVLPDLPDLGGNRAASRATGT